MITAPVNTTTRFVRIALGLLITSLALALGWAVWTLPLNHAGLRDVVQAEVPRSGADNPVTAVLLNFRGYDTLLEVGLLLIALLGTWALPRSQGEIAHETPGPVFTAFARLLAPPMVLVAAYLTWVGAYAPGGAFQGAAVLGAIGVLLLLIYRQRTLHVFGRTPGWALRLLTGIGFVIFLGVALLGLITGGRLLEYPPELTGGLFLVIELMLTLSIAVILVALFPGGPHPETFSSTLPLTGKETR